MDFFSSQEDARRNSTILTLTFVVAVAIVIVLVYFALNAALGLTLLLSESSPETFERLFSWWNPYLFAGVALSLSTIIFLGTAVEVFNLRRGGGAMVAQSMGGRLVQPNSSDSSERQLLNVVEEMAIASGLPTPPVYILDYEESINAFAAGYTPADAVVAVTHGLMHFLDRDETQAVIAHEFSHIINGDICLNIKLMGTLHGILMIHMLAAHELIEQIPNDARDWAHDPFGARALIYALLLEDDNAIREKQLALIESSAEPEVFKLTLQLIDAVQQLRPEAVLPLVDLTTPALKILSETQYRRFRALVEELIAADDEIDLFEFTLLKSLIGNLEAHFDRPKPPVVHIYSVLGVAKECSILLSMLARTGHDDEEQARQAFQLATAQLKQPKANFEFLDPEDCSLAAVDLALDDLASASPRVKRQIVAAALQSMVFDKKVTVEEAELFRAISYALDCPVSIGMLSDSTLIP